MDIPLLIETGFAELSIPTAVDIESAPVQPNLSLNEIARIARLMAMNISPPAVVLRTAGITPAQFEAWVQRHPIYQNAFNTFLLQWESPLSTEKRIAIQAAAALEDAIPDIAVRMADENTPLTQVTDAARALAKFAGVGEPQQKEGAANSERVTINITTSTPPSGTIQIQSQPQGESARQTISIQPIKKIGPEAL